MKKFVITVLTTVFFGCFLGKAQSISQVAASNFGVFTPTNSQFEVKGNRLITQNFQSAPTGTQFTGNFTTNARWNSMGSLTAASQTLNGFRTQTDGRGLTLGYSIPNSGTVGNPTIQWIGSVGVSGGGLLPGNLEFRYATNPTVPGGDVPIFTMAPTPSVGIPSFCYAAADALVGQLQSGTFGSFTPSNTWSATGKVITGSITSYGARQQFEGYTHITGLSKRGTTITVVQDFGNNSPAGAGPVDFRFRGFTDPTSSASIKNIWQSNTRNNNLVLGRQDYSLVNSAPFYLSLFDGQAPQTSSLVTNFVNRAGIYATTDSRDEFGNNIQGYASIIGEINPQLVDFNQSRYALLGITDGNATGNVWAGYFVGDVAYTGNIIAVSDEKFKTQIKDETGMLAKIMQLSPKNYFFDTEKNKNMALSKKLQHGLISQDVEKIFPELVQKSFGPSTSNNKAENGKPESFKGLNYTGLIPMLIKAIQEQQLQIDELRLQLENANSNSIVITDKSNLPREVENKAFTLSQNSPNPFSEQTSISYTIPAYVTKAMLAVFDLNGKMLLQYNLLTGKNILVVKGGTLAAGMYLYSLIADGQEVLSKRMVLTK